LIKTFQNKLLRYFFGGGLAAGGRKKAAGAMRGRLGVAAGLV
jgi:hypothetical protein